MDAALQAIAMFGIASASVVGYRGRHRTSFFNDFTYNKYHFGVYLQIFASSSLFMIRKMNPTQRLIGTGLMLSAIAMNSVPAMWEGYHEMKMEPLPPSSGLVRRIGFYCFVAGGAWIFVVNRGYAIPFIKSTKL